MAKNLRVQGQLMRTSITHARLSIVVVIALLFDQGVALGSFNIGGKLKAHIGTSNVEILPNGEQASSEPSDESAMPGQMEVMPGGSLRPIVVGAVAAQEEIRDNPKGEDAISFEVGGKEHPKADKSDVRQRPELAKSSRCKDDKCQECSSKTECWHGVDALEDVVRQDRTARQIAGRMRIDVTPSSSFTSFAFSVLTQCASAIVGNFYVSVERLANGKVSLFSGSTSTPFREISSPITRDHVGKSGQGKSAQWTRIPNIGGVSKWIRVAFSPHTNSQASSAEVLLLAWKVDAYVEECIAVKECAGILGDGGAAGYELRNKNEEQLQCLEGEQESLAPAVAKKCVEWRACIPDKRQQFLKTFLRSMLLTTKRTRAPPATSTTKVWNPDAICGGASAAGRAKWLENHRSMSTEAAREKVMKEFPAEFKAAPGTKPPTRTALPTTKAAPTTKPPTTSTALPTSTEPPTTKAAPATEPPTTTSAPAAAPTTAQATTAWNPNTMCGHHSAGSRAKWLMDHKGMSEAAARDAVMKEFPSKFTVAASFVGLQGSCVDPGIEDPESWSCECMEYMLETCGGDDEECFRGLLCNKANICDAWKQEHCPASLSASLAQRSIHNTSLGAVSVADAHELSEKRIVSINAATEMAQLSNGGGLDDTLSGKCSQ